MGVSLVRFKLREGSSLSMGNYIHEWACHESDFHKVTQYGSKMCHATVTGVTGCNLRWGQDPGCTYKDKVVVVSVPHDGGWEDWWRGGMVGYTPGGTAPPLRPSPHRPPGVVHMRWKPRRKNLAVHRPWNSKCVCLLQGLPWRQNEKDLRRSGCHPIGNIDGFIMAPQPWMNCFANSD